MKLPFRGQRPDQLISRASVFENKVELIAPMDLEYGLHFAGLMNIDSGGDEFATYIQAHDEATKISERIADISLTSSPKFMETALDHAAKVQVLSNASYNVLQLCTEAKLADNSHNIIDFHMSQIKNLGLK